MIKVKEAKNSWFYSRPPTSTSSVIRHKGATRVQHLGPKAETGKAMTEETKESQDKGVELNAKIREEPLLIACGLWAPQERFQPTCQKQYEKS